MRTRALLGAIAVLSGCATTAPASSQSALGDELLPSQAATSNGATTAHGSSECAPGYELLSSGACLLVPARGAPPLVLFLHGMYDPAHPAQQFATEARLGALARERGVAVLIPRGVEGLCDWSPNLSHWRCWPSHARQKPIAGSLMVRFGAAFREASARLRLPRMRPVIAGHSNGGYFAAMIGADTRLEAAGYAIVNAGSAEPSTFTAERAAPTLLVLARGDAHHHGTMERLRDALTSARWPVTVRERDGEHALTDEDMRAVLDFAANLD